MLLKKKVKVGEPRDSGGTIERKTKVHAQRKFAQGSPSFIIARDREARENCFTNQCPATNGVPVSEMAQDVMIKKCPKTEDFLSFLCFRGSDLLPESLNYLSDPHRHNFLDGRPPTPDAQNAIPNNSVSIKVENGQKSDAKPVETKGPIVAPQPNRSPLTQKKNNGTFTSNGKHKAKTSTISKKESVPVDPKKKTSTIDQKKKPNFVNKDKKTSAANQKTKIPVVSQKKTPALPRIHSNFRRTTVISRVLTRRSHLSKPDPGLPAKKKENAKLNGKACKVTRKIATRLQRRNRQVSESSNDSSNESSSSSLSSASTEDSNADSDSSSESSPPVRSSKQSTKTASKNKPKKQPAPKKSSTASSVSKNTRQSVLRSALTNSPKTKVSEDSPKNSPTTRKAAANAALSKNSSPAARLKATTSSSAKTSPDKSKTPAASPGKLTRDAARRLSAASKSSSSTKSVPISPLLARRPSRRTKEAAAIYMTIIGQEEELDSSEIEEQSDKLDDKPAPNKKKAPNTNERKRPTPTPPSVSGIRTRRSKIGSSSSLPSSPEAKKRAILREATKRFKAVQKNSSSSENSGSSSSSEEEEEKVTPIRSIRTRSFDPAQAAKNSTGIAGIIRLPEDSSSRQTRASSMKKPPPSVKDEASAKPKKPVTAKTEPTSRKRPVPSRTVATPPLDYDLSSLIKAPVFHPTEKEFNDPMEYLMKIREESERFGICRIVPPASFKPECQLSDGMRFTAYNQYVHRMFRRKGANSRVLEAIRLHLDSIDINCHPPPCIGGIEVDLPGLYLAVEDLGGPGEVLEKNLWSAVADMLKIPRASPDRLTKLDAIYCKFLLPYATLSDDERTKLLKEADDKYMQRPGPRSSSDDEEDEENECVVKGSSMALNTFYRVARNMLAVWFPNAAAATSSADASTIADPEQVEAMYWKLATERTEHVSVHTANIDTGQYGYGFPCNKTSRHPWNLKVLTNNNGSVLRSLGPVAGCTAPTLHVGMLFSTSCWYRDPHGLPWIDYLHTGADRIWYGAPTSQEPVLKRAMTKLVPDLVKSDKSVWLSSDTVMVPPTMLADEGVSLSRTVQQSGQFIVIWPRAFTSSLCTGYTVSESVYFAPQEWLPIGDACFKELRVNCEPAVFSLQQLLWNISRDTRTTVDVLKRVLPLLQPDIEEELELRASLKDFGVHRWEKIYSPAEPDATNSNKKRPRPPVAEDDDVECEVCRTSLFFSRVEFSSAKDADEPTVWCLSHALQKIKERSRITQNLRVRFVHDDEELRLSLQRIRDQIRSKSVRRNVSHQRSSTL